MQALKLNMEEVAIKKKQRSVNTMSLSGVMVSVKYLMFEYF